MSNILQFDKKQRNDDRAGLETILWCDFKNKKLGGSCARFGILKNKETGEIAIGLTKNYIYGADDTYTIDEVIILCDDDDGFIYDKINGLFDNE